MKALPANRRVTLTEIARKAGVSPTTVSNVVNGKFELMSADTRSTVERLIDEFHYRPQASGRNLRLARRHSIGLIIVDDSPMFLADPFLTYTAAGLSNYLSGHGYTLVIDGMPLERLSQSLLIRHDDTDALCVIPSGSAAERKIVYACIAATAQPVLVFQDRLPTVLEDACSIRQDDHAGGEMIARRLIERGARRLLMLVPERIWPGMAARERGMRAAISASAGNVSFAVVRCGSEDMADTQRALAAWTERHGKPDAILGGNDRMGIAAMKYLQARGVRVPEDVAVTGFNAFESWQYATPTLTTVRSPAYEMGERGAELLLERLAGERFSCRNLVLDVSLQVGQSD
jgi:LacI family transcriptional regulator